MKINANIVDSINVRCIWSSDGGDYDYVSLGERCVAIICESCIPTNFWTVIYF
jgi:hypothetical protein